MTDNKENSLYRKIGYKCYINYINVHFSSRVSL